MTATRRKVPFAASLAVMLLAIVPAVQAQAAAQTNWTSYLGGPRHTSFTSDSQTTKQAASHLKLAWKWTPDLGTMSGQPTGGLYSSPTVFNHVIYIGAQTGVFYALDEATGHVLWKRFLGFQPKLTCAWQGFVSTAAVVLVANSTGSTTPVVYVAAPDGYLYAMDGISGAIRWQSLIAKPSATKNDYFNWSSPTIVSGRIYVGFSSNCDNPFVRGGLMEFNQASGNLLATYYTVPAGAVGGGVWTSAAATSDAVFITTGSAAATTPGDSFSIVRLDPTSLARVAVWTVPIADRTAGDADFGSSPIVFNATLNGVVTRLVGACNKDGFFYALRTGSFSAPLWRFKVGVATSDGGSACLAGGVYDGAHLFLAGNETTIRGVDYQGSVREVDPATGHAIWELGLPANVLGAPSINGAGVIAAATHDYIPSFLPNAAYLIDSGNGSILATLNENNQNVAEFSQPVFADQFLLRTTTKSMFAYRPPILTIKPTSGPPGSTASISGSGFGAAETVTIWWDCGSSSCTSTRKLGAVTSDANGNFSGLAVTIPAAPAGTHSIGGKGGTSGAFATTKFRVTPTLTIQPNSGPQGSTATVSSQGYGASETVTLLWNCASSSCASPSQLGTATSDANGNFSISVTIPSATAGTYRIRGKGNTSLATAYTSFIVTS